MFSKFVLWQTKVFIIILHFLNEGVFTGRGGFLHFRFMCYENPDHLNAKGYTCDSMPTINCDPYFTICISNLYIDGDIDVSKCPLYHKVTSPFNNEDNVCNQPNDNRGELGKDIIIDLTYPVSKQFYVKIEIKDSDQWTAHQPLIATFYEMFEQNPSPNFSTPLFKEISMFRKDFRYANSKVKLKIAMALQCERERFDDHCLKFCRSTPSSTYTCSNSGRKICKKGWQGEECLDNNPCAFQKCVEGAKCIEVNKEPKCFCNGQIGPQCYPDYNPCLPNPCQNQGLCIHNNTAKTLIQCRCNNSFYGLRCENKIDMCQLEPCRNNASCGYDKNNVRRCNCLDGYSGRLCDHKLIITNTTGSIFPSNRTTISAGLFANIFAYSNPITILIISVTIIVLLFILVIGLLLIKNLNRRKQQSMKLPKAILKMNISDGKPDSTMIIQNEYCIGPESDTVYEKINDLDIYVGFPENQDNDDYLIPKNRISETDDTCATNNATYLDMSGKFDPPELPPRTSVNFEDSSYSPALPKRDIKKRLTLKTICL